MNRLCFEGTWVPRSRFQQSLYCVSSTDEFKKRQVELHTGRMTNRATGQPHKAECDPWLRPPDSAAELALYVGGTQER